MGGRQSNIEGPLNNQVDDKKNNIDTINKLKKPNLFKRLQSDRGMKSKCKKPEGKNLQNIFNNKIHAIPSVSNRENEKIIIEEQDRRKIIDDANNWPYSCIGVVYTTWENEEKSWGTGTLIFNNVVLTCAHNIIELNREFVVKKYKYIEFVIGANGNNYVKKIKISRAFYLEDYEKNIFSKHDYAILILDEFITSYNRGWMGIHSINNKNLILDLKFSLYGYPGDKVKNKENCYEMWGMEGSIIAEDDMLKYNQIDTFKGQSGSPIFYEDENNDYYIIGVHSYGDSSFNWGVEINDEHFLQIEKWIIDNQIEKIDSSDLVFIDYNLSIKALEHLVKFDLKKIKSINLTNNNLTDESIKTISEGCFYELEILNLTSNQIESDGAEYLSSKKFCNLKQLYLGDNFLENYGVENLTKTENLKGLKILYLFNNNINNEGASHLKFFINLVELNLSRNDIADDGVVEISQGELLNLKILYLYHNSITEEGLNKLVKGNLKNLKELYLGFNYIGPEAKNFIDSIKNKYDVLIFSDKRLIMK